MISRSHEVLLVHVWTRFASTLAIFTAYCSFFRWTRHMDELWTWRLSMTPSHSKCEWTLWSLPCGDYLVDQALIWIFTSSLLDHLKLVSYAFHVFLHTMIIVYCRVSRVSCSYDSSASQLLELGVNEFCSTVPNSHVKSRVCFRVLSRNSQRGRL